jgi:signal transduction histidine kinase
VDQRCDERPSNGRRPRFDRRADSDRNLGGAPPVDRRQRRRGAAQLAAIEANIGRWQTLTVLEFTDVRRLVYALRPPALDDLGLVAALGQEAGRYGQAGPLIRLSAPEKLPSLPAAVEVAAYRIVQEALANVVRHADA